MASKEPGRGRKQCPKCKLYVGVRSTTCEECQHCFDANAVRSVKAAPEPMQKVPGAGPGKKQCPGCKNFVGVRTHTCECGHDFYAAEKKPTPIQPVQKQAPVQTQQRAVPQTGGKYQGLSQVVAPGRKPNSKEYCPYQPKGWPLDEAAIRQWVSELIEWGVQNEKVLYLPSAVGMYADSVAKKHKASEEERVAFWRITNDQAKIEMAGFGLEPDPAWPMLWNPIKEVEEEEEDFSEPDDEE